VLDYAQGRAGFPDFARNVLAQKKGGLRERKKKEKCKPKGL
jgi:hypothetical protein